MADTDPHIESLASDLRNLLVQGRSPDDAVAHLASLQEAQFHAWPDLLAERLAALKEVERRHAEDLNRVSYLQRRAVRFGRQLWYSGPAETATIWNALRGRLVSQGRTEAEVKLVDEDSTTVVALLDNPTRAKFSTRGLVVGHVQSGKTGNMAAVVAKAADTQYKFFLVLSGMTDQLRNQTQTRFRDDVVGAAPERWFQWTSVDTEAEGGDYHHPAMGGFSFDHRNQLAVVKKNGAILRRLLAKIRNTDAATLSNTPFLIIDDECDQASVNSALYDAEVTRINDTIRSIIRALPRVAYVGYTATPFANILIDTSTADDLYPKDFIHALDRPPAYFGAQELFGRKALNGEYDEGVDGFDMIRSIPAEEVAMLRPSPGQADAFTFKATPALETAIKYFIMVIAVRAVRGQGDAHSTMLVHTSVRTAMHRMTERALKPFVERLTQRLRERDAATLRELEAQWNEEQEKVLSEQFDRLPVSFSQLAPHLSDAASAVQVHVENFTSVERLDYSKGRRCYLVIGGNVLARGLTLEGLSVSFFLRSSSQYDTLMQMGRWFGYRNGFEDLPRVWVEEPVREMFYDLATVEAEIRREIARYAEEEITPEQFAVRIRKIPGMTITARAKMRRAVEVSVGFEGEHVQTFRFRRNDRQWLQDNWDAGSELVRRTGVKVEAKGVHRILRAVPVAMILAFLDKYSAHPTHKQFGSEFLRRYIREQADQDVRLSNWSVVVVGGTGGSSVQALGPLEHVNTVVRSAEKDSGDDASIKALMSRRDLLIDLEGVLVPIDADWEEIKRVRYHAGGAALLLLYPINGGSAPSDPHSKTREELGAKMDVLGIGLAFPGERAAGVTYVAANLQPVDADLDIELADPLPTHAFDAPAVSP